MGDQEDMFLGYAIKEDRKRLKISQEELQRRVKNLSIERDQRLSYKKKGPFF